MENEEEHPPILRTCADMVRCVDRVPRLQILRKLNPGFIVSLSCTDNDTKEAVRSCFQELPSRKRWPLGYTVIFMKNRSEIKLRCKDSAKNFKWKFMDSKLFHESEKNIHLDGKVFTVGVSTADNSICAMKHLRRIMDIFPAQIDKLIIYTDAFIRKDIALEISKIGEVKLMYIDGIWGDRRTELELEAYDILFEKITVRDHLHVRNVSRMQSPSKIAQIPFARLDLPSAPAPEVLFAAASQKKSFSISQVPRSFFNSLIHCWLKSDQCDMDVLSVYVDPFTGSSSDSPFDGLFDGLKFVEGTRVRPQSDSGKPITEWEPFESLLARKGFEIRRKDGATLCLCYSAGEILTTFILSADYPGRSIRAEKMDEYCDQYAHILQVTDDYLNNTRNDTLVSHWVQQNKHLLDAAEKARHDRFHAASFLKDALEMSNFYCENSYGLLLSEEIQQFFQAEERKAYGYFELD